MPINLDINKVTICASHYISMKTSLPLRLPNVFTFTLVFTCTHMLIYGLCLGLINIQSIDFYILHPLATTPRTKAQFPICYHG